MSETEEKATKPETGIMGQIRRLSRRFSGTLLNVDTKSGPHMHPSGRKTIYSYDGDESLRIGINLINISHKNISIVFP